MHDYVMTGLILSLLAGLSTTVGAAIAIAGGRFSPRWMSGLLGLAAGVMVAVSFVELYAGAVTSIGLVRASIAFFTGFVVIFVVDVLVPHHYQTEVLSHGVPCPEPRQWPPVPEEMRVCPERTGVLTALGIAVHNFPEGLVIVSGAAASPELGVVLAIAIALHNIPEGIAVAAPIIAATGNRRKALAYTFLSGLAEPVGALLGALFLNAHMTPDTIQLLLAGVAGLMVFISLDELLPTAHRYREEHAVSAGVLAGMIIMVATLALLR